MKQYRISYLLLLLLLTNCSSKKSAKIEGNWFSCGYGGYYIELYAKGDYFMFCTSNIVDEKHYYKLNSDTLIYTIPYKTDDSVKERKAKVSFLSHNKMIWEYFYPKEKWQFEKLDASIEYSHNKLFSYNLLERLQEQNKIKQDIRERAAKCNCPDLRTKEQKQADSINLENVFQF